MTKLLKQTKIVYNGELWRGAKWAKYLPTAMRYARVSAESHRYAP